MDCISSPLSPLKPSATDDLSAVLEKTKNEYCKLFETCSEKKEVKLWANEMIDRELMLNEMSRIGVKNGSVKIAIPDTGFDLEGSKDKMSSSQLDVIQAFPYATEAGKDYQGHGTAVSGFVGGKDVGTSPSSALTVYSIISPGTFGGSSEDASDIAFRACQEGNEIINLSLAKLDGEEEKFIPIISKKRQELLGEMGCLIVKAAGNQGFRQRFESDENNLAILTVEALAKDGATKEGTFSSNAGDVSAPGIGVFTLKSAHQENKGGYKNTCDDGEISEGSSFASPVVAGIAANALAVLKLSPKFKKLSGPQRILLLKNIIKKSKMGASVNGLRAVLLAEAWGKNEKKNNPLEVSMDWINLNKNPVCNEAFHPCKDIERCSPEKKACLDSAKKKIALCFPPKNELVADFLMTIEEEGYPEIASIWMQKLNRTPGIVFPQDLMESYKSKLIADLNTKSLLQNFENYSQFIRMSGKQLKDVEKMLEGKLLLALKRHGYEEEKLLLSVVSSGVWNKEKILEFIDLKESTPSQITAALQALNAEEISNEDRNIVFNKVVDGPGKFEDKKIRIQAVVKAINSTPVDNKEAGAILNKIIKMENIDPETLNLVADGLWTNLHETGDVKKNILDITNSSLTDSKTLEMIFRFISDSRFTDEEILDLKNVLSSRVQKKSTTIEIIINALNDHHNGMSASNGRRAKWPFSIRSEETYLKLIRPFIDKDDYNLSDVLFGGEELVSFIFHSPISLEKKKTLLRDVFKKEKRIGFSFVLGRISAHTHSLKKSQYNIIKKNEALDLLKLLSELSPEGKREVYEKQKQLVVEEFPE